MGIGGHDRRENDRVMHHDSDSIWSAGSMERIETRPVTSWGMRLPLPPKLIKFTKDVFQSVGTREDLVVVELRAGSAVVRRAGNSRKSSTRWAAEVAEARHWRETFLHIAPVPAGEVDS